MTVSRSVRRSLVVALVASAAWGCSASHPNPSHDTGARDMGMGGGDTGIACAAPRMICGGACIDVTASDMNCGGCDVQCSPGVSCAGAACSCRLPGRACGGACVNVQTDAMNCGACGTACNAGDQCIAGTCIPNCTAPRMICYDPVAPRDAGTTLDGGASVDTGPMDAGTVPVCADLMTDPNNCGFCGVRCRGGGVCTAGRCACPMGLAPCGGVCVDLTSIDHCGDCRTNCGAGGICQATDGGTGRRCVCGPSRTMCSGGVCSDLQTDSNNCGMCGRVCPPSETCVTGMCSCGLPSADCGAGCIDLRTDAANCGRCGNSCGVGGVCSAMTCACAPPYNLCGGTACTNTQTDPSNCGTCGTVCSGATPYCIMGACSMIQLYHGWASPIAGCVTTSYNTMAPTAMGGFYPFNTGDTGPCRAWKLAATVCTTAPVAYGSVPNNNWTCPAAGGFTSPAFGTYCAVANQYACTDCYGLCNAVCAYNPLSLRNCTGMETAQM